jgi:shikimate kinase
MKDQIWLIGFMATGKSRVMRPLAAALDWEPVDVDRLIEQRAGDTVAGVFRSGGEAAFRVLETEVIAEVARRSNIVVATGGGAVISDANRNAMRERGFIVTLDARPETIEERIRTASADDAERPLLAGGDRQYQIQALKSARGPLYAQADFIIQTDDLTPDQITHQILLAFRAQTALSASETA